MNMSEVMKNEIVISGVSGRFPEADNVEEFKQNLLEGKDMVTEGNSRWQPKIYDLPPCYGKLKDLASCDAMFFGISSRQAHIMDPALRILLEATYEALVDAGVSSRELRGSNTGVFIAAGTSETEMKWMTKVSSSSPYCILGCSRTMFANQISYVFDFKGPSCVLDTACSSSIYTLDYAVSAISSSRCDAAIVGGSNLLLLPNFSQAYNRLGVLSSDGKCKTFDQDANGFARAEGVAVIFLQKAKDARRCYATILGIKTNSDGYKNEDISFPSKLMKMQLYKDLYENFNIDPLRVGYVEAHGTGTAVGDPEETNSIAKFFCKNRKEPLLVGSVKSNMGHGENVSGLCAIIKCIIMFETSIIPKNLHFKNSNKNIPYLSAGTIKVVTENVPLNTEIVAINSAGLGGTNAHVVLKINSKEKCLSLKNSSVNTIPYLVAVSGRTEEAVYELLDLAEKYKNDQEFLTLMNLAHQKFTPGHGYRGYFILNSKNNQVISEFVQNKRPLWFIISGMGCQWPGMGNALMQFEVFRNSIKQCSTIIKKCGIDIEKYLFSKNKTEEKNILIIFVSIASFQIALIDLLKHIGIEPDGFIGHSFGEICCGYVDGLLTAEEAILCAYYRALARTESNIVLGAMAVVNLSAEEVEKICPPTVFVASDNSADNVTISGPVEDIDTFIEELSSKNIIVCKIESYNTAYHSKYISDAAPILQKYLNKLIPTSKQRSTKWISTSVPEDKWETTKANFSAEYYVNNFVSPVLFRQALKHVPKNAITIEIAATALFGSVLSKSIGPNSINISLVEKYYSRNLEFFLSAIGDIYNAGSEISIRLEALYPKIEFPVSRGTPMIGPAVKWDHTAKWTVVDYDDHLLLADATIVDININDDTDRYLTGHCLDKKMVFPGTGFVDMVWKNFSILTKKNYLKTPVVIENFKVEKITFLHKNSKVKFLVNICPATGAFSISESDSIVAKGKIREMNDSDEPINMKYKNVNKVSDNILLTTEDVYQELSLRGYDYDGLFKSVLECDIYNASSKVRWDNNWVTFLDGMLQPVIAQKQCNSLYYLAGIQEIIINPQQHLDFVDKFERNQGILVKYDIKTQKVITGGIQCSKVGYVHAPKQKITTDKVILEKYQFVPYDNSKMLSINSELNEKNILKVMLQIVIENMNQSKFNIATLELIINDLDKSILSENVLNILDKEIRISINATIATAINLEKKLINSAQFNYLGLNPVLEKVNKPVNLVMVNNIDNLNKAILLENIKNNIKVGGFLLLIGVKNNLEKNVATLLDLEPIATQNSGDKTYKLFKKLENTKNEFNMIKINSDNFDWISNLKKAMQIDETDNKKILLYNYGNNPNGLIGFFNCLKLEPFCESIRSVFMYDQFFDMELCRDQLKKNLVHNVYKNGQWGSYRHLLLEYQDETHKIPVDNVYLDALVPGDLRSLTWFESSPYTEDNECTIHYAALNSRDAIIAMGKAAIHDKIRHYKGLGLEFSGLNNDGKRVMGVGRPALAKRLMHPNGLWNVPDNWTLEEAATVPVAYLTSYFALIVKGKLQKNESVLIHSGAGATELAALIIAFSLDCEVFTTVSSEIKKKFLLNKFPKLKECNIGSSKSKSFEDLIFVNTEGNGVDVVLNSLTGDLLQASIRCLNDKGRFLQIEKSNISDDLCLPMSNRISFIAIALDAEFINPSSDFDVAKKLLNDAIKSGVVQPLPFKTFDINKLEDAFQLLRSGESIGKLVINMRQTEGKSLTAICKTYMNPQDSFIIVGGLGRFGLELTKWLIKKGAKNIVLVSRVGVVSGYQALCLKKWSLANINVKIFTGNVSTKSGAINLIKIASSMGKIEGIFNLAVVLENAIFKNQTKLAFEKACKCKVTITKHLDDISRQLIPDLKYFVVFSSYICGRGAPGLSNYAYGNSVIERICENRRKNGFHGLAIQWGVIGDVGVVARRSDKDNILEHCAPQSISSCLRLMNLFLKESASIVCSTVRQSTQDINKDDNFSDITSAVANVLGITKVDQIPKLVNLTHLGMNSLMLSEIKQLLAERFDLELTSAEITDITFAQLQKLYAQETNFNKTSENATNNNLIL